MFLIFSSNKKIREQKFENAPFFLMDEIAMNMKRAFEHPSSFRDETYGDVKMPGYNVRGRNTRGRNVRGRNVRGCIILVP